MCAAPSSRSLSCLADRAVATTVAPSAAPNWTANVPIPLPPPCTSRVSPLPRRATRTRFDQTVQATSGSAAASTGSTPAGTGSNCPAGTATRSAYPPPASSAHTC